MQNQETLCNVVIPTITNIENSISSAVYFTATDGLIGKNCKNSEDSIVRVVFDDGKRYNPLYSTIMFCVLTLKNGFTVTGECNLAVPYEIAQRIARHTAEQKIWPLLGYTLMQRAEDTGE